VHRWGKHGLGRLPMTGVMTGAWVGLCLLGASASLRRRLPGPCRGEPGSSGRSCLRRVRRWWSGPGLAQAILSPTLSRWALPVLAAE
jgi:hypothetical protein